MERIAKSSTIRIKETLGNLRHLHVSSPEQLLPLVKHATNLESLTIGGNSWSYYMLLVLQVELNSKSICMSEATIPHELLSVMFRSLGPDVESIELRHVALIGAGWNNALLELMQVKSCPKLVRLHVVGCYHIAAFHQTGIYPGVNSYLTYFDTPFITADESQRIKDEEALASFQKMIIKNIDPVAPSTVVEEGAFLSEAL